MNFSTCLFASNVDSIQNVVNSSEGSPKAKALVELAGILGKTDVDSGIVLLNEALSIFEQEENIGMKIVVFDKLGTIYFKNADFKNSIKYTNKLLDIYKKNKETTNIASTLNRLGAIYYNWGVYGKALEYFFQGLKAYEVLGNQTKMAFLNNNIGLVYKDIEKYDLALSFFWKSKKMLEKTNDSLVYAYCLNNMGGALTKKGDYDSALFYFNKSIDLKIELNDDIGLANTYGNVGDMYYEKKEYDKALNYYKKVLYISERQKNNRIKTMVYTSLGKTYYKLNFYEIALEYLNKAESYALDIGLITSLIEVYDTYSKIYEDKKDYKLSNEYLNKYVVLNDSISSQAESDKISELMVLYNMEAQEAELKHIKDKEKYVLGKADDFKHFMIITILLGVIVFIMLFSRYRSKIKNSKILKNKNEEIAEINIQLINLNKDLEQKIQNRTKELELEIKSKLQIESTLNSSIEKEKRANYLKNFFLSNISHEIRTPLNAISGLASLLKRKNEGSTDNKMNEFISGILQNSNRLLNLLNNIIDFSRLEANDIKISQDVCSANEIAQNICELHKFKINDKKLVLNTNFQEVPKIIADKSNLGKVLNDVVDNAVRYTDKGSVDIETGYYKEYEEVYIKVKDTGNGIDSDFLPHIFDSFTQESHGFERKFQGMGLGLPLAKRLVELMNGRIEISSNRNKGTIVTIFIPADVSDHNADISVQKIISIPDDVFRKKDFEVFVVEDDYFNKLVIHSLLERISKVTSASNGQEALDFIEKRLEEGREFDIMLIDINLPDGWDGIRLMNVIKEKWPIYKDIIFIAQTAYSNEKDRTTIMDAGFNEYVTKPIDGDHLINMVKYKLMQ